jgi:iron complex outermembrane recepter protein
MVSRRVEFFQGRPRGWTQAVRQSLDVMRRAQKIRPATDAGPASRGTPIVHTHSLRRRLLAGLAACAFAMPLSVAAAQAARQEQAQTVQFDIPAGNLDAALLAFANQSGRQLLYPQGLVEGLKSPGLKGRFTPDEAIARLLTGAPVEIRRGGAGFVLKPRQTPTSLAEPLAQTAESPLASEPTQLEELVVTGTLIRGAANGASPVVTVTRDELDRTGKSTVADMLTDLPQAFGGAASADTNLANTDGSGTNAIVSTGVNLRGLGASATLVLVNGRRVAGSGLMGDFADVSALPTAAVDRVEVLLDGASALYGSDAVGGVVNVILRKDFDGLETRARMGQATAGGAFERQFAQTAGATWRTGHALVSFEHWRRDRVASADRAYAADADLRGLGGTDHRFFYSHPGNVLLLVGGSYVPSWAIPAGQLGTGLTPSSFLAGQINYENQRAQSDILPEQNRNVLYGALSQELTPRIELSGDVRLSRRKFAFALPGSVNIFTVNRSNPYFVSPNGASSNVIGYSFTDELGPIRARGDATNVAASLGADIDLGGTWRANLYGAYAQEVTRRDSTDRLNTRFLNEALGAIADDPATSFSAARDGYFNPYGDGPANSRAVLDFIGSGYLLTRNVSTVRTLNAQADGTLATLPGGAVKLALGGQYREEHFDTRTIAMTSRATPTTTLTGPFDRKILAGFAELRVPLVGPDNARPGMRRLELSLAGRIEHYDDVGTTRNPKIGLVWSPTRSVNLRASYGTSFRAPSLPEIFQTQDAGPTFLAQGATSRLVLLRYGGNLDLQPESAKSWTAGVDYDSRRIPGLKLSATWFDTRFKGQIGTPVAENITNALVNPAYAPFIQPLDPTNPADQAKVAALLAGTTSAGLYPTTAYTAIVDSRYVNTGGLHVAGVDLTARYGFALAGGKLDTSGNVSYLLDYERQVTPNAAWLSLLNQARQPVDLRAKLGATWTGKAWSLTGGANYVDAYKTTQGRRIDSWTTFDAQIAWRASGSGWSKGLSAALSVQNLFDTDPPFYDDPQGVGYDSANADPLGRFVSVQLNKRW